MSRYAVRDQILKLDPVTDHQRIVHLSTCFDFPFDTTRSLEFALFRTFAVPAISRLLDRTGEFHLRAQKRYDDTDIIVSELLEGGYDSERGQRAIRRMNQLHGRFAIRNSDFLYVLSTFIFEPIRWNAQFGWRPLCDAERIAYLLFWCQVGERMGIKEIPTDFGEFEQFNLQYERQHFRFEESNRRVGTATRELFVSWMPRLPAPLVRQTIYSLMDEPLIQAFGFPHPSGGFRRLVQAALKLRARLLRWCPPRRRPRLRSDMKRSSYPGGYVLEQIGPSPAAPE